MKTRIRVSLLALATLTASSAVMAQTAPKKPDGLWHGNFSAGLSIASGNTRSSNINLSADGAKETEVDKMTVYGLVLRGENKTTGTSVKSADLYRLGGRYDRNLTDRVFGYGGLELEKDGLVNLDLRALGTAGVGYKVIRSATTSFDVFGGVGYVSNNFSNAPDSSGFTVQLGEESTHALSPTSTFKQRLMLYPGLENSIGNRATWDLSLATAIAGGWTLNAGYSLRYFSQAPVGRKSTDSLLFFGAGYKF